MRRCRLKWHWHVERKDDADCVRLIVEGTSHVGRPRKTWQNTLSADMHLMKVDHRGIQDQMKWRAIWWCKQRLEHCPITREWWWWCSSSNRGSRDKWNALLLNCPDFITYLSYIQFSLLEEPWCLIKMHLWEFYECSPQLDLTKHLWQNINQI